ncbi:MAG: hypothetical protein NTX91_03850 [candidate division SR1 bacterium]|nr:hypothetical protein [candidate division SR1 bacterium]
MKIFSNFDTKLRKTKFAEYQKEYGVDNVLGFGRSRLYWWIKSFLPTLFLIGISILIMVLFTSRFGSDYFVAILIVILIIVLVSLFPIIRKYIDYKLDFIIVIPSCIMMYDQGGIFKRDVITISSASIKTISIRKDKFLYSVFDNGDIIILTEGDSHGDGEVTLRWIPKPEKRRNEIARVIGLDSQANQNPL